MCELFGISSTKITTANDYLKELFSHSDEHPNGWGIAIFYGDSVSLEKEPVRASHSIYLKERLRHKIEAQDMIAHIRFATIGTMEYVNCHPFVRRDNSGRSWTFAHNGTIFDYSPLNPYVHLQEGSTDSERILSYFVDCINKKQTELGRPLQDEEAFAILDDIVCPMAKGNKLNFLLYSRELMCAHTNYAGSLHVFQQEDTAIFSTVPLRKGCWEPLPLTTLCAYRGGKKVFTGTNHGHQYFDSDRDMKFIFAAYAGL